MCGLFYDYFSTTDNTAVYGRMTNDELEKIWKKAIIICFR
jgi:hypothetical protein